MTCKVENATSADLQRIEEIYAAARQFMKETGNPDQWGNHHPPHDQLVEDIRQKRLYIVKDGSGIHGVFYFYIGEDPTYSYMEDGSWRSDLPYGTIHRIASDGSGGILRSAVSYCLRQISHLRIDTHHDNTVMQGALSKLGFHRCGIIYLEDGDPRIAYDLLA